MAYLVDTGVLLRLVNEEDAQHIVVRRAMQQMAARGERIVTTIQNVAEFCSVATRPAEDNGLGRPIGEVLRAIRTVVEPLCTILREHSRHYAELKRLLETHQVQGKQVHDARLVASMLSWRVERVVTLNAKHFERFIAEGIQVETPQSIVGALGQS